MTVSYWSGSTNPTSAVLAGGYTTAKLSPGAPATMVVRIAVGAGAGPSDIMRAVGRASSVARPEQVDVVRAVAAR